jgi:hypothetical protein
MSIPNRHPVEETTIQQLQMIPRPPPPPLESGVAAVWPPPAPPPAAKPSWVACECATSSSWGFGNPEFKPEPDLEDHSQRAERDRLERPVPARDPRCLVMEMKRPSGDYLFSEAQLAAIGSASPALTSAFVETLDDAGVRTVFSALVSDPGVHRVLLLQPPALRQRIDHLRDSEDPDDLETIRGALELVAKDFKCRNGKLVQFNPALTACTKSNTAPYFLGTAEQARAAVFYVIKYVTKDKVCLAGSMSVLLDARKHIEKYPSVAADTGSTIRTGQHFLQRTLNTLAGSAEFGGAQSSSISLGKPGSYVSHEFVYLFPWDIVSWIKNYQKGTVAGRIGRTTVVRDGMLPDIPEEEALLNDFPRDDDSSDEEQLDLFLRHGAFPTDSEGGGYHRRLSCGRISVIAFDAVLKSKSG